MNEWFFRVVQMKRWTDMTRRMALHVGTEYMKDNLHNERKLAELNVNRQQVESWLNAEDKLNEVHRPVHAALSRFTDESVLRPNAAMRPAWASNPAFAIFWHLKSFMYAFHEQALRYVWNEMKIKSGGKDKTFGEWLEGMSPQQAAKTLASMSALLTLAIPALALSAMGYELRKRIGNWGKPPAWQDKEGADYAWEIIQRGGLLGPLQLMVDVHEAEDRKKLSILAALGPSVDHMQEFLTKDLVAFFFRSLPGFAQSPAARDWARNNLFSGSSPGD
jgi:hypothetical protein